MSLEYLNKKLVDTNVNALQKGISDLILQQIEIINLSEISDEYALKIVDSPTSPETKSKPYRTWLTLVGGLMGFILSVFMVLILYYTNRKVDISLFPPTLKINKIY